MRDRVLRYGLCALILVKFYPGPEANQIEALGLAGVAVFLCLCIIKGTVDWSK